MKQDRDTEQSPEAGLDALREHYRRIGAAGPPAAIDAAVLGQARAALRRRPRVAGWWVPATLAATVVIAFSLLLRVQQEPVAPVPAEQAAVAPQREAMPQAPAAARSAAVTAEHTPPLVRKATSVAASAVAPPAEPVATAEEAAAPAAVTARPAARAAAPAAASAPREKALADEASLPTAEEWLARIEELEAAGRRKEARAERERLEAAYPGWLAGRSRKRD
jgi:hypothetical protein